MVPACRAREGEDFATVAANVHAVLLDERAACGHGSWVNPMKEGGGEVYPVVGHRITVILPCPRLFS